MDSTPGLADLIGELRREIERLRGEYKDQFQDIRREVSAIAAVAAAAQTRNVAHEAVCDERQKREGELQRERDARARERDEMFKAFMAESSSDRRGIRDDVQEARTEARDSAIKVMWTIISMGATALIALAGFWVKAYGPHI